MTPPDFANFMKQTAQLNFKPVYSCQGRVILFSSAANALGVDLAEGQTCEVWWSPYHTFPSSITGQTPKEILDLYHEETGRDWTAAIGYKYAAVEIAVDVLKRCKNLEPETIRDAIAATDMMTVVGPIKYDQETHVAPTPIVMGQWQVNEAGDKVEIQIIDNVGYDDIPITAENIMMNQ
jgi:branched-chain amino acid transport system substrate-binding protein